MKKVDRNIMDDILYDFHRVIYTLEQYEIKQFNINWFELYLLRILEKNGQMSMSKLADLAHLKKFQVTRVTKKLIDQNLISKHQDQKDKRITLLSLSHQGLKLIESFKDFHFKMISSQIEIIDEKELEVFIKVIKHIDKLVLTEEMREKLNI